MEIKRDLYLQKLIDRMHNGMIKIITGIRRCGKSYLLFHIFMQYLLEQQNIPRDHIITMEFDLWKNREYRNPNQFMNYISQKVKDDGKNYYFLLDEIQMLGDFEEILNSLLHEERFDVYATGSNSRFLSKDVLTEFRGRGDEIHVFPLTFQEFMSVYRDDQYHGWADYTLYGGLPLTVSMLHEEQKIQYLTNLFQETYLKDIQERNKLEKEQEMEDLINILASSIGSLMNPSKIHATFQSKLHSTISLNTIQRYIEYLEDAFLISPARRYDVKGRKYIDTPLKYYFEDIGLRNARLGFRQIEETHIMENILYNELRVRGYLVDVGMVSKRITNPQNDKRMRKQLEIDFVANQGSKRYYIQSAYALPTLEKLQQEKASLLALQDSFKKVIIVKDIIRPRHDENGILTLSLFDFLFNADSLDW